MSDVWFATLLVLIGGSAVLKYIWLLFVLFKRIIKMEVFEKGDAVLTPDGPGVINYKRMSSLDLSRVAAYSVILNSKRDRLGYEGSLYSADLVKCLVAEWEKEEHAKV